MKRDPEDISPNLISNLEQTKVKDHKEAVKKLTKLRSPIPLESIILQVINIQQWDTNGEVSPGMPSLTIKGTAVKLIKYSALSMIYPCDTILSKYSWN